jgi:hypothetical protein
MTKPELIAWLQSRNFINRGKNWYRNSDSKDRYVIQDSSLRYEKGIDYSDGTKGWVMVRHAYITSLSISHENKLAGLRPWNMPLGFAPKERSTP